MREGAECGRAGEALPANKPLRYRRVSDGIGGGSRKKDGGAWGISPRNAPNLSGKAGKTLWEYPTYPRLKTALKRKFERKYGMT
ncbi:TPA: hypothetical protein ACE6MW_002167, partial [Neisseria gonorrhoeae]